MTKDEDFYYTGYDRKSNSWCVWNDVRLDYAYSTWDSEEEAEEEAQRLNDRKKKAVSV